MKHFVENESIHSREFYVYEQFQSEFSAQIGPLLLNLAINIRAVDDAIKRDKQSLKRLGQHYREKPIAFDQTYQKHLSLREISNKIIHANETFWYTNEMPVIDSSWRSENSFNEHEIMMLKGTQSKKEWCVVVNLLGLAEQYYEFSEVICEYCAL